VPSSSFPRLRHASLLPAQTRHSPASAAHWEEVVLAKLGPAFPATGQDVGQEGPVPHLQHTGTGAGSWGEKGLEKGTRPRIGAKGDGNPGSRGQPARQPGEHFCT